MDTPSRQALAVSAPQFNGGWQTIARDQTTARVSAPAGNIVLPLHIGPIGIIGLASFSRSSEINSGNRT
jgi:hypothetical protein